MRRFHLERRDDATGISGTGRIAEGALFGDGIAVLRWLTEHKSTSVYDCITDVHAIHGHGGRTVIVWDDYGPVDGGVADARRASRLCTECGAESPDCGCVVTDWGAGQTFHRSGGKWLLGDGSTPREEERWND